MARVPIIRVDNILIATVQDELHDSDAFQLQVELSNALEDTNALGVLIDISVVDTIDSFLGRLLADIASTVRLLGAHTIVVGMQPAIAITLTELGLDLRDVHTALNTNRGFDLLRRLRSREARRLRARGGSMHDR